MKRTKIGIIAPVWETVPPKAYVAREAVVDLLARELAKNEANEILLACSSDSRIHGSKNTKSWCKHSGAFEIKVFKTKHVARVALRR